MPTVLSPAEALGLSGAALDGRVQRAVHHIGDATFRRLAERMQADALASDMIYERDGAREPIRILLRPLLAMPEQLSYVHHVCFTLTEALKRLPQLWFDDPDARRCLALGADEEAWFRDAWTPAHQRNNPIYGRLDAVCDFTGAAWQDSLRFMEANLSGVGGIHYSPLAEQLVMRDIVPTLRAHDPGLDLELPRDQRELFLQVLIDHARAIGRGACNVCFVEPIYVHDGPDEQSVLSRYLEERHALTTAHADPRDLTVRGDDVFHKDVRVDLAYRDYELRDLVALERELGRRLDGMRLLFRQNRVVSSLVGDFDHKSCLEILTDPVLAERHFGMEEARVFRRHVLWTRIVSERRTSLPHREEGDLVDFARRHREELVLKPNRGYGGRGVVFGAAIGQGEWERLIGEAAAAADDPERSWVVQSATRLPVHEFPVLGEDGRVFGEPFYAVMGFTATDSGLGVVCRVSQKQVVNIAQRGGMAAVLVARAPGELRIPKRPVKAGAEATPGVRAEIGELRRLDQTIALLGWDEETMLPAAARAERGDQLASLEALRHNLLTSDRLGDLMEEAALETEGDPRWTRELALLRRSRRQALALPEELIRAFAQAKSRALGAWEEARAQDDFAVFAPAFETVLGQARERAQALAPGEELYDAALEDFEPGMTRARLDPVLGELRDRLAPLVRSSAEQSASSAPSPEGRMVPEAAQWELCRDLLAAIGFDFARGRLDRSTHPFTLLAGANDVRLTIRVHEDNVASTILTTLHEGGHALYDQGLTQGDRDCLLSDAPSMGLHECQARLWENHVGRLGAFWAHLLPALRARSGAAMDGLDADAFRRAVNRIRPSLIRVDADPVSYHLHIFMRYELEIALFSGALAVRDLPAAWRERSAALIGAAPACDREGVLQDVHWAQGLFGYFPSYTLGSLYAAQLVEAYERDHALADEIGRGDFASLRGWLAERVYAHGQLYSAEEVVLRATGKGLDAGAFLRHIERTADGPSGAGQTASRRGSPRR